MARRRVSRRSIHSALRHGSASARASRWGRDRQLGPPPLRSGRPLPWALLPSRLLWPLFGAVDTRTSTPAVTQPPPKLLPPARLPPRRQVLSPYDAEDARGLLKAAIRDDDPVIFLENEILYGQAFPVNEQVGGGAQRWV